MSLAWFICPYKQKTTAGRITRYCAMDDFTTQIYAEGGAWTESEVLGGYAVVKVKAATTTLATIAGTAGFIRVPKHVNLTDALSDLTTAQRNVLRNLVEDMGYTPAEISASLGADIRSATLGQVLRFMAQRRLKPRWDAVQSQIVLDGALQECRPIASVDAEITE